ncbi:MAG: DNA polymerase IV [Chloroflexi bacterium]|nr:DNA polymerase IV [Chloroflexota bacterium]MCY3697695.1 DNA polymerase IV [Chloroflexota bacterium]
MTSRPSIRHIVHADMDAFFASVEQRDRPELRGKPVLVGGSPKGRGVVAAASYESRVFGCRSAMPMRTAVRLCPQAEIVRPRFSRYREVSTQIMSIFRDVSPLVEPLSVDEAFIDITLRVEAGAMPAEVAQWIRQRVREATELTVSCGVATSKSVAKIASDQHKPDGLMVVGPGDEAAFLAPLPISDLWGVGPKTADRLRHAGIETIGDLAQRPLPWLIDRFGSRGEFFWQLARGIDDRPLSQDRETKSISSETTFAEDVGDEARLRSVVGDQSSGVARRLVEQGFRARTVQLKLRLSDFTTFTRQRTLSSPTQAAESIERTALALLQEQLSPSRRFRLVGVGVAGLERQGVAAQLSLFDESGRSALVPPESTSRRARQRVVDDAVQELNQKYGGDIVHFGPTSRSEEA